MYPIDIDYGEKQDKIINLDSSSSKLPKPVQQLVKMIFDIDMMNKTMLEFQVFQFSLTLLYFWKFWSLI